MKKIVDKIKSFFMDPRNFTRYFNGGYRSTAAGGYRNIENPCREITIIPQVDHRNLIQHINPYVYFAPNYNELDLGGLVSHAINELNNNNIRRTPSATSSYPSPSSPICATTITDTYVNKENKDKRILDETPVKKILTKLIPWILDVTSVRIKSSSVLTMHEDQIPGYPLEVYITVSPIHHTELMNPTIETKVRERLNKDLIPLLSCVYGTKHTSSKPTIIFSPVVTETILELL
jgi:hypothetical protein